MVESGTAPLLYGKSSKCRRQFERDEKRCSKTSASQQVMFGEWLRVGLPTVKFFVPSRAGTNSLCVLRSMFMVLEPGAVEIGSNAAIGRVLMKAVDMASPVEE